MIDHHNFTCTLEQWNPIRTVVFDRLGLDADQTECHYGYREVVLKQFIYAQRGRVPAVLHRDSGA